MKVVTFGEIMLRLGAPDYLRLNQCNQFDISFAGAEANVAVSLANYGVKAEYITRLPKHPIADKCISELLSYRVDVSRVIRGGKRIGILYLETGSNMRSSCVYYDREDSSFATIGEHEIDWEEVLKEADWFHWTGITPALSESTYKACLRAIQIANRLGVTVSCDINYRGNLWSSAEAQETMTKLMPYVDVCVANEEDAEKVLGSKPGETDVTSGELEMAGYKDIFNQMCDKFGFKFVISSLRESFSASHNGWSACIMDGASREFYRSRRYEINPIVDRVGGGDSFAGGLICGLLDNQDKAPVDQMKAAIEYAVAASALKHTIPGDFNLVTRADVEALAGGDGSGRVQR